MFEIRGAEKRKARDPKSEHKERLTIDDGLDVLQLGDFLPERRRLVLGCREMTGCRL